jgi:hypothetical protein
LVVGCFSSSAPRQLASGLCATSEESARQASPACWSGALRLPERHRGLRVLYEPLGVDVGPRLHWGEPNDPTLYRHNLYAFYDVQALDGSFQDDRHPEVRTRGHLNGVGLRYDYNNVVAFDNPTHKVDFRLFGDWFDRGLGSSFAYADWGGRLSLTHPLWTHRTILAGEITNGFSEPLGSSRVPLQGLYSLGGSRSIRGIGAEDELARNIFLVRTELRQTIYPELDLNLLDVLVLRRAQVRLFVDTGQVSNSAGAVYDPRGYAVGASVGFAAVCDSMGSFHHWRTSRSRHGPIGDRTTCSFSSARDSRSESCSTVVEDRGVKLEQGCDSPLSRRYLGRRSTALRNRSRDLPRVS